MFSFIYQIVNWSLCNVIFIFLGHMCILHCFIIIDTVTRGRPFVEKVVSNGIEQIYIPKNGSHIKTFVPVLLKMLL